MEIKKDYDRITPSVKKINKKLSLLPKQAFEVFLKNTPIDNGYARNHTSLRQDTIVADYSYAKKLDKGYSKQAPQGMTDPTIKEVEKILKKVFKK